MSIILYLWQLPQNIIGLLVILITGSKYNGYYWDGGRFVFCVCLGKYIIINGPHTKWDYMHECGHHRQSKMLGWLYLPVVGLPSVIGNIWDRLAHKSWEVKKRLYWYYNQPWEKWADDLGGVFRMY